MKKLHEIDERVKRLEASRGIGKYEIKITAWGLNGVDPVTGKPTPENLDQDGYGTITVKV